MGPTFQNHNSQNIKTWSLLGKYLPKYTIRYKVGPFDLRGRLVKQMDAKLLTSEYTILQIDPPKVLLVTSYLLFYWGANGICICTCI